MTAEYLKTREQFGAPIGANQALQHRAAHLYSEMEVARAAVLKAQQLLDDLLDHSKLGAGRMSVEAADFDLRAFHRRALDIGGVGLDVLRDAILAP